MTEEVSDFSRPLTVLKTCHVRMREQCDALRALVDRIKVHGPDADAQRMAAEIVRYFDTAARFHHEDEEDDLLPRMIVSATMSRGSSLTRLVASIATEHREMDRAWTHLRALLQGYPAEAPGLWLEVPEDGALRHIELMRELVNQMHSVGARVGLEHAGERLTEAAGLLESGLDFVKLDASFVEGLAADHARREHVAGAVRMLHGIGLKVYAEGVTSSDDATALDACDGCERKPYDRDCHVCWKQLAGGELTDGLKAVL